MSRVRAGAPSLYISCAVTLLSVLGQQSGSSSPCFAHNKLGTMLPAAVRRTSASLAWGAITAQRSASAKSSAMSCRTAAASASPTGRYDAGATPSAAARCSMISASGHAPT